MSKVPPLLNKPYDISGVPTLEHYFTNFGHTYCACMAHVNSAKTTAMVMKSLLISRNQHPNSQGVRETRHMFVRGTHGDLLRGVVSDFEEWINSDVLAIRKSPPVMGKIIKYPLFDQNNHFPEHAVINGKTVPYMIGGWNPETEEYLPGAIDVSGQRIGDTFPEGTFMNARFDFVPLDNPDWEQTLLGTQYTAIYMDEPDSMSNIKELIGKLPTRMGRYPPAITAPITTAQINMAYNPPSEKSYTQEFFHPKHDAPDRKLYRMQPPFLVVEDPEDPNNYFKAEFIRNPNAEGVRFAPKGFTHWHDIIEANRHDPNKIKRDVLGQYTQGSGGDLVHPDFNRALHVVPEVKPNKAHKLFCSLDWGASGAALFGQFMEGGLHIIEEKSAEGVMSFEFVEHEIIPYLNSEYRGFDIIITGDPSGAYRSQMGEGPFTIFSDRDFLVEDDMDNDPPARWTAVNNFLKRTNYLKISEDCVKLLEGFEGEYTYKKQKDGVTVKQVDKRKHHTAYQDCLQAMCQLLDGGYETASSSVTGSRRHYEEEEEEDTMLWV